MLRPLNDLVLLEEEEPSDYAKHRGLKHIVVPEEFRHGPEDRPVWGIVRSLGKDCQRIVKKGERVVIGKWEGSRQSYEGKKYLFVRECAILGVERD